MQHTCHSVPLPLSNVTGVLPITLDNVEGRLYATITVRLFVYVE